MRKQVVSAVETQRLFQEPRKVVEHYAAGDVPEGEVPKVRAREFGGPNSPWAGAGGRACSPQNLAAGTCE